MTGLLFVFDGRPWTAGLGLRVGSACFVVGLRGCNKEDRIATVGWDCVSWLVVGLRVVGIKRTYWAGLRGCRKRLEILGEMGLHE